MNPGCWHAKPPSHIKIHLNGFKLLSQFAEVASPVAKPFLNFLGGNQDGALRTNFIDTIAFGGGNNIPTISIEHRRHGRIQRQTYRSYEPIDLPTHNIIFCMEVWVDKRARTLLPPGKGQTHCTGEWRKDAG